MSLGVRAFRVYILAFSVPSFEGLRFLGFSGCGFQGFRGYGLRLLGFRFRGLGV